MSIVPVKILFGDVETGVAIAADDEAAVVGVVGLASRPTSIGGDAVGVEGDAV